MGTAAEAQAPENLGLMLRVRMDEGRVAGLRALAGECGSSMSAIVRLAVDRELSREQWALCECGTWLTEAEVTSSGGTSDVCLCNGYGEVIPTGASASEGVDPIAEDERAVSAASAAA